MSIAFFDLDKTLLCENSGTLWVRSEFRQGRISLGQTARASWWLARYHMGFASIEHHIRAAIGFLEGTSEQLLTERMRAFYVSEVRELYRPGARAALKRHQDAGQPCVLLTTATQMLASQVTEELGLGGQICNRLEVDSAGNLTGRPVEPLCFGIGKRTLAERYCAQHGASLAECTFYTDSVSDVPVLEQVHKPVAVNPDPRLKSLATERGWQIDDWGEPVRPNQRRRTVFKRSPSSTL